MGIKLENAIYTGDSLYLALTNGKEILCRHCRQQIADTKKMGGLKRGLQLGDSMTLLTTYA